jgi:hypothetical protein
MMSFGNSWGNGWSEKCFNGGNSGSRSGNKDPEGTHNASCIAGSGSWGNSGLMKNYYDESCSGCRHDRSKSSWGSPQSGGNPALKIASLFGIGVLAKKSLWD